MGYIQLFAAAISSIITIVPINVHVEIPKLIFSNFDIITPPNSILIDIVIDPMEWVLIFSDIHLLDRIYIPDVQF